jgi:uncharacterized protein YprB with RNaseH-like and TPR domain
LNWYADLETTGLSGKSGDILLLGVFLRDDNDDAVVIANGEVPDDDGVTMTISNWLDEHQNDNVYGYNWFGFDLRFLNDRRMAYKMWPRAWMNQYDLKENAKKMFPYLPDHKLDTIAKALDLEEQKTPLDLAINFRCANDINDVEAWKSLTEHCVADVKVLRAVHEKMYFG